MIVPRIRLIFLTTAILIPAAYWQAYGMGAVWPAWLAAGLWAGIVILDAGFGKGRLRGIQVTLPEVIRMTVERLSQLDLLVHTASARSHALRLGLALPGAVRSERSDLVMDLVADQEAYKVAWPCTAMQRGRFAITTCYLESGSFMGLWSIRRTIDVTAEIRVYPNLVSGQRHLRGLFRRGEWGLRTQRRVGKGREFEQLREYLPGDNFEDIDWKATARRRRPVTRVFQVEQAQEIYVVVDGSRLSTRQADFLIDRRRWVRSETPVARETIFDRYVIAALVMAVVAEQVADRYGLLVFSDQPDGFIKAGRGHAHYNACREMLYDRIAHRVSPDFGELFTFVGTHLRKRALLVFLTSLDDPMLARSFVQSMQAAAGRHVLMVNMFRPPGAHPLFSSADIRQVQGIYQHLAGHTIWESIIDTRRHLQRHGAGFALLDKTQLCSQLISQYLEVKQRQAL